MVISTLSVKRPIAAAVVNLLILVFGIFALGQLSVREAPDINPPIVSVNTSYTGAAAEVVESRVTKIVEDYLSGIEGVETITSDSSEGHSRVTVAFDLDRDIDNAANDVRDRVNRALRDLPEDIEAPRISKADENADEVMWLTLRADHLEPMALTDMAERLVVDRLTSVDGVAQINVGGEQRYALRVWLDRDALTARGLTVADVDEALRRENVELPAGRLEGSAQTLAVRTVRSYQTPDEFNALPVATLDNGDIIRLGELARVEIGPSDTHRHFRANGREALGLGIIAQADANVLDVAAGVKAEVERIIADLPEGTDVGVSYDSSVFVDAALDGVLETLVVAIILVTAVIYLFLGSGRMTIIAATAIPVSLLGGLLAMWALGFTINVLTLLAFVLAAGLVVDDAIVVVESIWRRFEKGEAARPAAISGARTVGVAVIATTGVLVAVFAPLALQQGDVGRLFAEFALTMAATVIVSTVVALTLVPAMSGRFLGREHKPNALIRLVDAALERLEGGYRRALTLFLRSRVPVVVVLVAAVAAVWALYRDIPQELTPPEDRGGFWVVVNTPEGSAWDYAKSYVETLEDALLPLVGEDGGIRQALTAIWGSGEPRVRGIVALHDWETRGRSQDEIMDEVRANLADLPGATTYVRGRSGLASVGGGNSSRLSVVLGGPTYEDLARWRDIIVEEMEAHPGLRDPGSDYNEKRPQLLVTVDRARAAELGVSAREVGRTLQTALASRTVSTFVDRGEEYDVILQAGAADRDAPADITGLFVRSDRSGDLIPLETLVSLEEVASASSYNRYQRMRAVTISASLGPDMPLAEAVQWVRDTVQRELPGDARLSFTGAAQELVEATDAGWTTFALALAVAFLVLAAQFESLRLPTLIMMTVPLAMTGALFGLWVTGLTLNIYSQIGIVMLVGLAAKNGILLVEYATQLAEQGSRRLDAAVDAAVARLRPVLMTAISTAAGAVPLILSTGAGHETRQVLGVVILSGIAFATLLTLFVVPTLYRWTAVKGAGDRVGTAVKDDAEAPAVGRAAE
ncbi:Acriflavin resistance protein [Caenispirillum salinarum AK4]|uniref:Acriflavin resistance protein n=1 Tax=Caenispirillum salinarum AK4 TaxID=1238182 RepID=K9H7N5_9PROT|nr:efflux RND transporter permease subunit [Caenispirillum salinarum]EKV26593.1 Acriflavin resistance protein [Caenispirillum salinarum AK4]